VLAEAHTRAQSVLHAAAGTIFTGAVARVEREGRLVWERAFGTTRLDGAAQPVYCDTVFDLASLTKPFVSTAALAAVASGALKLDEPLGRSVVPEWRESPFEGVTSRMLLAHTAGLQSGADYRQLLGEDVERYVLTRPPAVEPKTSVLYSDFGFIVLGVVLERVHGRALSGIVRGYRPRFECRAAIPATEDDGWRGRVQGVVHDEKAYLMGGVAGHAGLFGTASGVARLGEVYLAALHGRATSLDRSLAREAVREQAADPVLRRGLGWALKTTDENSCGRWFSPQSFGHTGFVGTCIWADPERDLCAVLLTNSVYFGRNDTREFRARFFEAVIEDLGLR